MATIQLLEGNDPETGGILFTFSNNLAKQAAWRSAAPIADPLAMAKDCVAQVLDSLLKSPSTPAVEQAIRDTNWVSAVAGAQHQVKAWNERLRARIAKAVDNIPLQ